MIESLTPRERQVLQLIASGRTTRELATELGIAFKTAACHRQRILDKCEAGNTAELVQRAVREGWTIGPASASSTDDRMQQLFVRTRMSREVLSDAVARSRVLRGQCRATCAEVRKARAILRQNCKELAAAMK